MNLIYRLREWNTRRAFEAHFGIRWEADIHQITPAIREQIESCHQVRLRAMQLLNPKTNQPDDELLRDEIGMMELDINRSIQLARQRGFEVVMHGDQISIYVIRQL